MKTHKLSNGYEMPSLGFGVWKSGEETENAVRTALEKGYRNIDAAFIYGNEEGVGKAIKNSSVKREEIILTTKLWNDDIRSGNFVQAFERSLELLGLEYIDVYLIHWPATNYEKAWLALEELYNKGLVKAIGVCNFNIHHFETLEKVWSIKPMINQIESNPHFTNQELIDYCQQQGILVQVYSPLGGSNANLCENSDILEIAKKYNKTAAQIILRWDIQRGVMPLPKSVTKERIESNFELFDFELSSDDMLLISNMNQNKRSGADPDNFDF